MTCHDRYILEQCYAGIIPASEVLRLLYDADLFRPPAGLRAVPNYERGMQPALPPAVTIHATGRFGWTVPLGVTGIGTVGR